MSSLLMYSLKSAMVLVLLYLPYTMMLRRESFFRFNRLMLLGIMALSLLLPLCNIPGMSLDRQPVVHAAQVQMIELGIPVNMLPELLVTAEPPSKISVSIFMFVSLIYIIGMVAVLVARLWQVGRLWYGLKRGALWKQQENGITICCHAEDIMAFSWMDCIVISEQDYNEAGREIILHETGHIRCGHSWDVLLLTVTQMLQWWNPLVYVLGISLRDVHEYEADDYVLRQGVSAQEYQLLLIKKAVGSGSYAFANNFNHSLTKKRITMMLQKKSNPWMLSKALYVIPVAALALSAFATPKFIAPIEGAVSKLEGNNPEQTAPEMIEVKEGTLRVVVDGQEMTPQEAIKAVQGKEIVNTVNAQPDGTTELTVNTLMPDDDPIVEAPEVNAEFPGGMNEMFAWMSKNVHYPQLAQECGVQGRVLVQFIVGKDGSIGNIKIVKGLGNNGEIVVTAYKAQDESPEEITKENVDKARIAIQDEAVRVVKAMPRWKPGTVGGEPVRVRFTIPISFRLN